MSRSRTKAIFRTRPVLLSLATIRRNAYTKVSVDTIVLPRFVPAGCQIENGSSLPGRKAMTTSSIGELSADAAGGLRCALMTWQVKRVESYIDSNMCGRLRVPDLARIVALSPSHFCRIFKATFNLTVHCYVMQRRIESAKRQMLDTSDNLCSIALSCGMSDQAHLTRCFRKFVGMTPSAWRREQSRSEGTIMQSELHGQAVVVIGGSAGRNRRLSHLAFGRDLDGLPLSIDRSTSA